jgi:Protein of unknown function (DUF559)
MENLRRSRGTAAAHGDRELAKLAGEQHGVVAWRQLREIGLSKAAISHRIQTGRLHRLHLGVYAVGHRTIAKQGWWMAAVLSSGPSAVLSHRSVASFWRLRIYTESAVEVTAPRKSTSSKLVRRHKLTLPADEVTTREGIPVTIVPRTILDLAATQSAAVVSNLLREAEYRQLYDRLSVWDIAARYPGRRGVRRVRTALELLVAEPPGSLRSRLEEGFASFLHLHDLPLPRFNDWILLGARRYQVDCHWPGTGQIVELDGWQAHGTRTAFQADRRRDRALSAAGYSVTRVTWHQLRDEPEALAADLRALLTRPASASLPA